jgi:hypothetical protein
MSAKPMLCRTRFGHLAVVPGQSCAVGIHNVRRSGRELFQQLIQVAPRSLSARRPGQSVMPVRLLDAYHDITIGLLRLADRQFDGLGLAIAMGNDPAFLVDHVPMLAMTVDMEGVIGTGPGHFSAPPW